MATTNSVDRVRTTAHRRSIEVTQTDLVSALTTKLGSALVAYMVGRDRSTLSRWQRGTTVADEAALQPLRVSYQIVQMLEHEEADPTIRAWFMGSNPQLDDMSPVEAIHEGRNRDVIAAARAFLAGG